MNQKVTFRVGKGPRVASAAPATTLAAWVFDTLTMKILFPALGMTSIIGPALWQMHLVK